MTRMHNIRPIVSFTFDDFPLSALTFGGKILKEYGACGTFYISGDQSRPLDYDSLRVNHEYLSSLVQAGHELGCHTYTHLDCCLEDEQTIIADIEANRRYIDNLLPGYKMKNFAYPYGNISIAAKSTCGEQFRSSRGISGGLQSGYMDLSLLRAQKLYNETLPAAFRTIDSAVQQNGWLIFFSHDIDSEASEFGITPRHFEKIVEYASRAECCLLTIDAALDVITSSTAP